MAQLPDSIVQRKWSIQFSNFLMIIRLLKYPVRITLCTQTLRILPAMLYHFSHHDQLCLPASAATSNIGSTHIKQITRFGVDNCNVKCCTFIISLGNDMFILQGVHGILGWAYDFLFTMPSLFSSSSPSDLKWRRNELHPQKNHRNGRPSVINIWL